MILSREQIKNFFSKGSPRSLLVKRSIVGTFICRGTSILISLLLVPATIHYVNPSQYGIFLTLVSIISWTMYFDFGFSQGFRNRFAEAKATGNISLAKKYVSTTYAVLIIIFSCIIIATAVISPHIRWNKLLNINCINQELSNVFFLFVCIFCIQIILNMFTMLLYANQRPATASLIGTIGQFIALITIYLLSKTTDGNLVYLTLALTGAPCITTLLISIIMYKTQYKTFAPSFKSIEFKLVKSIMGLGSKFFIIQISMLFIIQFTNIILMRVLGAESVVEYNIAYKYFSIIDMAGVIILTPFWSAFTDAYTQQDLLWMKNTYKKLSRLWLWAIPCCLIMFIASPWVYKIWIHDAVNISPILSIALGINILMLFRANIHTYLINGTGKISLLLIIYVCFSLLSIPTMIYCCNRFGIAGITIAPSITYIMLSIIGHLQLQKILNRQASGIWNK